MDLADQLRAAAVLAVQRADGLGPMDDHLLATDAGAKTGRHIAGRQHRLGTRAARVAVVERADAEIVQRALGAERLRRGHAMGIDNITFNVK